MDGIKEILDALNTRIRSPIFGSIAIAFIITNWKPLFHLAFSDSTVSAKFIYFDANTTIWSLAVIPIAIGLILAISSPWIALFSTQIAEHPSSKRKLLQVNSVHKSLLRKQELEQTRKQMLAETEIDLIQAAKRDEEVKQIQDREARENLQQQIEELRKIAVTVSPSDMSDTNISSALNKNEAIETRLKHLRAERDYANKAGSWDRVNDFDGRIQEEIDKLSSK